MKKLIILLVALGITTNNLQSAINEAQISTAISKLTANINNNQAPNDDDIKTLKDNLKSSSALAPGIGNLQAFINSLNDLLQSMQKSITKCSSYPNLLKIFQKLFDASEESLQNLLKQWDTKSNFLKSARESYLTFYSNAANLYLKLLIAQEYINNNKIDELKIASIEKLIDDLVPDNLSDQTFKDRINTRNLEIQRDALINAFTNLANNNQDFIKNYCQLQEEYAKDDWKDNKKYWEGIEYDDDDTYENLDEWEDTPNDKIAVLKNYLKNRIEPLYGANLKTIENNLGLWLGIGNDVLSNLEKEIKDLEPQKTEQAKEAEAFTSYLNQVKKLFKQNLINIIDDKTFDDELAKLREKINKDALLSPETKNDLLGDVKFNLINLQEQKKFATPLISYLIPENIDPSEAIQKMEEILSNTFNNFPQNITLLAGAANLASLQKNHFEIAKNIYDLQFKKPDDLPKGPSPQDETNRDTVNAYIKAATLLEKKPKLNTPDRDELQKLIAIIENADKSIWQNIKSWLPPGIKDIKEEYKTFTNQIPQQTPIPQEELLASLTNLSVELMALRSKI